MRFHSLIDRILGLLAPAPQPIPIPVRDPKGPRR